uniref:Uncharacterized protein n=1 Tax=Ditylenchus dipsaci TaxID=166011 RepID=A0A915CM32_9BILA
MNPHVVFSQPQVKGSSEESKQLSIQWKKSAEGNIQNTIESPCLHCLVCVCQDVYILLYDWVLIVTG